MNEDSYLDLYEFAPVGYLTLSRDDRIEKINILGAELLGESREKLIGEFFISFISSGYQAIWFQFHLEIHKNPSSCELKIVQYYVRLDCVRVITEKSSVRITLTDVTSRIITEQALRESEQKLQAIYNAMTEGLALHEIVFNQDIPVDYVIQEVNPSFERILGKKREDVVGRLASNVYDQIPYLDVYSQVAITMQPAHFEAMFDGKVFSVSAFSPSKNHFVTVFEDITVSKQMDARLRLAASVFSSSQQGIMITDADIRIIDVNPAFSSITGYSREDVLGQKPSVLSLGCQLPVFYKSMWETINESGFWHGEILNLRKDGNPFPGLLSISAVKNDYGIVTHYVEVLSDISLLKSRELELEQIAYYDPLTKVPNRRLLADRLNQALAHAKRSSTFLAVCYLDLDGFKLVNDKFGHDVGDRLLVEVTGCLQTVLRANDTIARLGGDEFALLLCDLSEEKDCLEILERILQEVRTYVFMQEIQLSISIGVSIYPLDDSDADGLLRNADHALYQAKESGKNKYIIYDAKHSRGLLALFESRKRLTLALSNNEFVLYYQPKVNLLNHVVIGAEALIRWAHPELGLLSPDKFLPDIAGSELEIPLGEWVIRTALSQIEKWQHLNLKISVNISAYHLQQANFATKLRKILSKHSVKPQNLELEILESAAIKDVIQASSAIENCEKLGVEFSLDDFGTGYSSLTYLRNLPVKTLKIDQTFVIGMLANSDDLSIVKSVIYMAHTFHRTVVAEGIESAEHMQKLVELGCHYGQGYYIARPMPASDFLDWIGVWAKRRE